MKLLMIQECLNVSNYLDNVKLGVFYFS